MSGTSPSKAITEFLKLNKLDQKFDLELARDLAKETADVLRQNDLKAEDVVWVGNVSGDVCMSWEDFIRMASGFIYRPRGRCAFATVAEGKKTVSYYDEEDNGWFNRVAMDLVVVADEWMLRRFVHVRESAEHPSRTNASYTNSPEYWEVVKFPQRNTPMLVEGANFVRMVATDNFRSAGTLATLNTTSQNGDPEFKKMSELDRTAIRVSTKPKRRIGSV